MADLTLRVWMFLTHHSLVLLVITTVVPWEVVCC
jgi:hypothetical protein